MPFVSGFIASLGLSAFATTLLTKAITLGLSLLGSYLLRPDEPKKLGSGIERDLQAGADVPASAVYGKRPSAGHLYYYHHFGGGDKFNHFVYRLSHGWCDGLEPYVIVNGEKKALLPRPIVNNEIERWAVEGFGENIIIKLYDGRPGQTADPELVAEAEEGRWGDDCPMGGMTYVSSKVTWDAGLFGRGLPTIKYILRGLRLYDIRKDTSLGGLGDHRLDDPATWEFSENPALIRFNYQLGLIAPVSGRAIVGMGYPESFLDRPSYIESMNVCDALRLVNGETVPTYACGLVADGKTTHKEILDLCDNAMAGYGLSRGGLDGVSAGAPKVPVKTITDSDIRINAKRYIRYRRPRVERINYLSGQFRSSDALWEMASFEPITSAADVVQDKIRLSKSFDLPQISHGPTSQLVSATRYRQNRLMAKASLPLGMHAGFELEVGDWVEWSPTGEEADTLTWLVEHLEPDESFDWQVTLCETSAAVYNQTGIPSAPIISSQSDPINPLVRSSILGFDLMAGLTPGENGLTIPALNFVWQPPDDNTIDTIVIKYWDVLDPSEVFEISTSDVESGELIYAGSSIKPGRLYAAMATIRTNPPRFYDYTAVVISDVKVPKQNRAVALAETQEDIQEAQEFAVAEIRSLKDRLMQLSHDVAETNIIHQEQIEGLEEKAGGARASINHSRKIVVTGNQALAEEINSVQSSVGDVSSEVETLTSTVASNNEAIAEEINTVQSSVGDVSSSVDALAQSVASSDEATAVALSELDAALDDVNLAEGLLKFEVIASDAGVSSTIAMFAKALSEGDFSQAGMLIKAAIEEGEMTSSILFDAKKFTVVDGENPANSIKIENGILSAGQGAVTLGPDGLSLFDDT